MDAAERAQRESLVMAELIRLAGSDLIYADLVRSLLDLVEEMLPSPLICLSVVEAGQVGHYARAGRGQDAAWAESACRVIADAHERQLDDSHRLEPESGWYRSFMSRTRSGRGAAVALGAPETIAVEPVDAALAQRLIDAVLLVLDHALLLQRQEELERIDRLTGAVNHHRLLELLEYEMRRHHFARRPLALLLLDVEGLATINQAYGRHYGNHILRKLTALMQETVRPVDVVARYGLDELAILLPETDEDEAQQYVDALRERLLTVEFAGGEVGLTVAVVHGTPNEGLTPEGLLRRGEHALAEAKRHQRTFRAVMASRA